MKGNLLKAIGWLALHALRLLWHILAALGSRWAKKKLDPQHGRQPRLSRNPLRRAATRLRATRATRVTARTHAPTTSAASPATPTAPTKKA